MIKNALIIFSILPFAYFAWKDTIFHLKGRAVTRTEHVIHFILGFILATLFVSSYRGHWGKWLIASFILFIVGSLDEFIFHKELPLQESDWHAKEHWSLLLYMITCIGMMAWEFQPNWFHFLRHGL
ncbi:hypothetical protein K1X76_08890 [bacterium]|nr:hypothetical protein [bacterium]